jgi:hypothetical protein
LKFIVAEAVTQLPVHNRHIPDGTCPKYPVGHTETHCAPLKKYPELQEKQGSGNPEQLKH